VLHSIFFAKSIKSFHTHEWSLPESGRIPALLYQYYRNTADNQASIVATYIKQFFDIILYL
jgi:hypothetical protein